MPPTRSVRATLPAVEEIDEQRRLSFAAQAMHWVDPAVRYVKAAAALAPGGLLAVVYNEKAPLERSLREELDAAYVRCGWQDGGSIEDAVEKAQRMRAAEIDASGRFGA